MTDNNHNSDSSCGFSETLVAVLYNEANEQESAEFRHHLAKCGACSEEFAAFGMMTTAVSDWRETEFAPLLTPNIVLLSEFEINAVKSSGEVALFDGLRRFLSLPQFGWQMAATFGALSIFMLLGFALIANWRSSSEKLVVETPPFASGVSAPSLNSNSESNSPLENVNVAEIDQQTKVTNNRIAKPVAVSTRKSGKAPKQVGQTIVIETPKRQSSIRKQTPQVEDIGILPDETEDTSPRLTDLLDEIEPSV